MRRKPLRADQETVVLTASLSTPLDLLSPQFSQTPQLTTKPCGVIVGIKMGGGRTLASAKGCLTPPRLSWLPGQSPAFFWARVALGQKELGLIRPPHIPSPRLDRGTVRPQRPVYVVCSITHTTHKTNCQNSGDAKDNSSIRSINEVCLWGVYQCNADDEIADHEP